LCKKEKIIFLLSGLDFRERRQPGIPLHKRISEERNMAAGTEFPITADPGGVLGDHSGDCLCISISFQTVKIAFFV
jgi:hypothetical protein